MPLAHDGSRGSMHAVRGSMPPLDRTTARKGRYTRWSDLPHDVVVFVQDQADLQIPELVGDWGIAGLPIPAHPHGAFYWPRCNSVTLGV